jgi:PAS domain S-box-containing protein
MTKKDTAIDHLKEGLFKTIFDNSSERMLVLDANNTIKFANKSFLNLLEYAPGDVVGHDVKILFVEKDYKEFEKFLETVSKNQVVRNHKFYLLTSKKSIIRLFLTAMLIADESQNAFGYFITISPVYPDEWSALKDPYFFQSIARKLSRLTSIGQLTSVFVHDIKNPLHVILSTSELLQSADNLDENSKSSVALIDRNVKRASKIVKTLLDFSKSGACQLRPCLVNEIIDYCLGLLDSSLKTSRVAIVKEFDNVPKVFLDPHYLHSVVYNLLSNAAESLPEKNGEIRIKTTWDKDKEEVGLIISDNGSGINPNVLSNLFTPFFTTKETGTGLGLYLAKQIMNEHSGKILVESKHGIGTKVTLVFTRIV